MGIVVKFMEKVILKYFKAFLEFLFILFILKLIDRDCGERHRENCLPSAVSSPKLMSGQGWAKLKSGAWNHSLSTWVERPKDLGYHLLHFKHAIRELI